METLHLFVIEVRHHLLSLKFCNYPLAFLLKLPNISQHSHLRIPPAPLGHLAARSRRRWRRDVEGSNGACGNTPADGPIGRDSDADALAVVRLVRDPARRRRHVTTTGNLDADAAGRGAGANHDDSNATVDVLKRRALDARAAAAGDADGTGAHEPRPVGEGPEALRHLVVVGGLLVDADHLLVGRRRRPLHPLPVEVARYVVADERAVDVVGLRQPFARAAVAVPARRPLALEVALLRQPDGDACVVLCQFSRAGEKKRRGEWG